jgi:hypothetical protein
MRYRSDTILLVESVSFADSLYTGPLNALGYWNLHYANYSETASFRAPEIVINAVVAVWTDGLVPLDRFARAVSHAASLPRVRGALIVSPFATEPNARLLAKAGAKSWACPPVSERDLDLRLRCILEGDRRRAAQPIAVERRRPSLVPARAFA